MNQHLYSKVAAFVNTGGLRGYDQLLPRPPHFPKAASIKAGISGGLRPRPPTPPAQIVAAFGKSGGLRSGILISNYWK